MKSTIATILGTVVIGLLKKPMGSSVRLSTTYRYTGLGYFDVKLDECLKAVDVTTPIDSEEILKDLGSALQKLHDTTKFDTISPNGIKISISTDQPAKISYDIRRRLQSKGKPSKRKDCSILVLFDFTFDTPNQINNTDEENFLQEELCETVKSSFLNLLEKSDFSTSALNQWSDLENWGPAQLADGHWFGYGKKIVFDVDTGEEYTGPEPKVSKLRRR